MVGRNMFNEDSTGPLPTPYRLGSRVGHIAPLYEAPHEAPRFFSHTGPIIHPSSMTKKIQEDMQKEEKQKIPEQQSWLAEKFENLLGLKNTSLQQKSSSHEDSLHNNDSSKMSYQQCIELQLPIEKCKQLQTNFPELK
jgi:hypothetical protein